MVVTTIAGKVLKYFMYVFLLVLVITLIGWLIGIDGIKAISQFNEDATMYFNIFRWLVYGACFVYWKDIARFMGRVKGASFESAMLERWQFFVALAALLELSRLFR